MSRVQINKEQAISQSTRIFWQNGFNGTSMQQIFTATGLKPGSIYLAFGNKENLYREALKKYSQDSLSEIKHRLNPNNSDKNDTDSYSIGKGICQILLDMVKAVKDSNYCSCFLVKSVLELASENTALHEFSVQELNTIEALYSSYLELEFGKNTAKIYAASLMLHIFGLRVYGYRHPSQSDLFNGLKSGLSWLPWKKIKF